jgi:L-fuconolactonase
MPPLVSFQFRHLRGSMTLRIDAHQHFWRYSPVDHAWMDGRMAAIQRDFLPEDLQPRLESLGFDGCVAVQARQSLEETRWLLDLADAHPGIRGVVGWVDLRSPAVAGQIAGFASRPRLKGVRHVVHDEPDDRFLLGADFRRGIAALDGTGLVYDLLLFPRHLPIATELVAGFPRQSFILDHLAKPGIKAGTREPWATDLRRLAAHGHVACKLSGLVTEADWAAWRPADLRPYLDIALEAFGPQRLLIGSDWPVCQLAGAYAETMAAVLDWTVALRPAERDAILGGNAVRLYHLEA